MGLHLTRDDLVSLTGTVQPKRMCDWLAARQWPFELPARRGDIPKVSRAYHDAKLSGVPIAIAESKRGRAKLDFMLRPS